MGANRYWCENSFGAIKKFLWIEIGHFVAIFLHFWAFLVTLMAVATTILLTLGTGCTKRLLRHMGWWYGTIFALLSHIASAGWGQKWLIFEVKIRSQWQASSRAGNQPGNRFMCHITSQYMGPHGFGPFLTTLAKYPYIYLGPFYTFSYRGWGSQKWSIVMLSHVLGGDMAHKKVSRLVPCPGTSLPLRPDFDLKISHFWPPPAMAIWLGWSKMVHSHAVPCIGRWYGT